MNALLEVSERTWREVRDALVNAGRRDSLLGEEMDMDGITLVASAVVAPAATGASSTESLAKVAFHWVDSESCIR